MCIFCQPLSKELSKIARTATVLPGLKSTTLLSMGKLCDDNNMVIFDNNSVKTISHNQEIATLVDKQTILLEV